MDTGENVRAHQNPFRKVHVHVTLVPGALEGILVLSAVDQ